MDSPSGSQRKVHWENKIGRPEVDDEPLPVGVAEELDALSAEFAASEPEPVDTPRQPGRSPARPQRRVSWENNGKERIERPRPADEQPSGESDDEPLPEGVAEELEALSAAFAASGPEPVDTHRQPRAEPGDARREAVADRYIERTRGDGGLLARTVLVGSSSVESAVAPGLVEYSFANTIGGSLVAGDLLPDDTFLAVKGNQVGETLRKQLTYRRSRRFLLQDKVIGARGATVQIGIACRFVNYKVDYYAEIAHRRKDETTGKYENTTRVVPLRIRPSGSDKSEQFVGLDLLRIGTTNSTSVRFTFDLKMAQTEGAVEGSSYPRALLTWRAEHTGSPLMSPGPVSGHIEIDLQNRKLVPDLPTGKYLEGW
ncbi:hypothetical protein SAMN05192558_101256 [Actinokineospora alba]|uniref:Uncharacterized protein n=1 Tax=Actinokineospora alba TaxID=504798 RepID=A0A1H0F722_9PSEU|nr:hypothetical protein [Actinokineospora alba]TDP69366.1 hypothetical protein C8E96_4952 [Actinokineospora alba]SDI18293.1 hypothetical protein SAMN05421871_103614 [Actinokineospora alba]SDN90414.1 hypothetical protein SAMN05192558_101256 [Actinokineospora alba]